MNVKMSLVLGDCTTTVHLLSKIVIQPNHPLTTLLVMVVTILLPFVKHLHHQCLMLVLP